MRHSEGNEIVTRTVVYLFSTQRAIAVHKVDEGESDKFFLPLSQIEIAEIDMHRGARADISMPLWLAEKNGLVEEGQPDLFDDEDSRR